MTNIFTPNAVVVVYNYIDREGDYNLEIDRRDIIENVYLISDLISIQTGKTKSQPAGNFSITLAPTYNWVTKLTPGSWLSIHMTPQNIDPNELISFGPKTLKMIGRIDTVQMSVNVNQETGARETLFTVSGKDWGQIFETILYIDPMAAVAGDSALGQIMRFKVDKQLTDQPSDQLYTSTKLIRFFIDIWGIQGDMPKFKEDFRDKTGKQIDPDRAIPESKFFLPKELVSRMNLKKNTSSGGSNALANNINLVPGRLSSNDHYKDDGEIGGMPAVGAIIGGNTLWQIFTAHCGAVVNELVTDFRWDKNRLALTLYKRVRPFLLKKPTTTTIHGEKISSSFFYIKKTEINSDHILSLQAGTNWRDKINFLEVLPNLGHAAPTMSELTPLVKSRTCSVYDAVSFGRDGFKPIMHSTQLIPFEENLPAKIEEAMPQWLPIMKQWYFNNHKMLNGIVVISNQEDYIGVGENIVLDASLFSQSFHVKGDSTKGQDLKMLAHVESVSNNFTVDSNGARNFTTTVTFVRGVFTDANCKKLFNKQSFGIDSDSKDIIEPDDMLGNVFRKERKNEHE